MTLANHNTTLCSLCKHCCSMAVISILFIQLLCFSYTAAEYMKNYDGGFSARLIRKHSPKSPLYNQKSNQFFRRLMGPDIPQSSLAPDKKSSEHLMKFSVGTPPFDIYAIADTGSSILWTQCEPCKNCFKTIHGIFDPRKSSSYHKITCSDSECRHFPSHEKYCKKNPLAPCRYHQEYVDTASSLGEVAKEVITLKSTSNKVVVLKNIVIGCGRTNKEPNLPDDGIFNQMGVIGLGRGPMSFISQISSYVGGRIFSQCLMPMDADPEIESYINFGRMSKVSGEGVVTTPLVDIESNLEGYYVTVIGISIGNDFLRFNTTGALPEKGSTFMDSGTSMSYLPHVLYERVVNQIVDKLDPKLEPLNNTKYTSARICFNTTTIPKAPNVALHFDGGGKLELTTGVIYKDEEEEDLVCLGFMKSPDEFQNEATLGNKVQGNILIGFDLDRKMVSFKPTNCLEMETAQSPQATEL